MSSSTCPSHAELRRAAAGPNRPAELRAHLATCPECRDSLRLNTALHGLASEYEQAAHPPSAASLRVRAQVERDRRHQRRASWPLALARITAPAIAVGLALNWFLGLDAQPVVAAASATATDAGWSSTLTTLGVAGLATLVVTAIIVQLTSEPT